MTSATLQNDTAWHVIGRLPSGETIVPGETDGCDGPDAWGHCPAIANGRTPACADGALSYGPEPSVRAESRLDTGMCPLIELDPLRPLD